MSRNVPVRKYKVTFEIELYAGSQGEGLARACGLVRSTALKIEQNRLGDLIERDSLPTGGIDGAAHGDTLDGWRCLWTVAEP